jgi:uracil-DNA glycosylase
MASSRNAPPELVTLRRALERHRVELAACTRCADLGLQPVGARPILSDAVAPRVMLVGQAPGKTEISGQKPFAGRAGRTLFRWLERAGLDEATARAELHIAAVTRCFPGAHPSGRGDRVPTPAEQDRCADWLDRELRIIRPRVLLLVGRLAIDRFLPPGPLDRLVGRAHHVDYADGRSLAIPLPHPSGASSWIHVPGHRELVDDALDLLGRELRAMGITGDAVNAEAHSESQVA